MTDSVSVSPAGDRLAKIIARAGLCSRRDAELWIKDGRVSVNGKVVKTPAFNVTDKDKIKVDGEPLAARQGTRVWLYHKPEGLVVTEKDPDGRPTVFDALEAHGLPRVVSIGRLDINTEGLLLLTNDGGLKRVLELPATGWLRKYRVRAFGSVTQAQLDQLKDGIEVDGIKYGPIEATLEREQGSNIWLVVALREGKNREVKNVLGALGLQVNRLIRISYGPFQLGDLPVGEVEVVRARVLREQLGKRLADEAGVDFDSDMPEQATATERRRVTNPKLRAAAPGKPQPRQRKAIAESTAQTQFRFTDRDRSQPDEPPRQRRDRPGGGFAQRRDAPTPRARDEAPLRTIHHEDGSTSQVRIKTERQRPDPEDRSFRDGGDRGPRGLGGERPARKFGAKRPPREEGAEDRPARKFSERPKRDFGDRPPRRDFGDRPPRREDGDRPARGPKNAFGDKKPFGEKRPFGDKKPFGAKKPFGDRPTRGPRAEGDGGKPFAGKPRAPRPGGPAGDRPRGPRPDRPAGDRPRGPKKPRG